MFLYLSFIYTPLPCGAVIYRIIKVFCDLGKDGKQAALCCLSDIIKIDNITSAAGLVSGVYLVGTVAAAAEFKGFCYIVINAPVCGGSAAELAGLAPKVAEVVLFIANLAKCNAKA